MFGLTGTRVLVTGAGRGLGRATAVGLVSAGATVVLTSRDRDALQGTIDATGAPERAHAIAADLAAPGGCEQVAREATDLGPVHVLVNNAGVGPHGTSRRSPEARPWDLDPAEARHFLAVNLLAAVELAGLLVPAMVERGWGRVVNETTSLESMLRFPGYGPSKAALEAATAVMALDLEGTGVTANVIIPGGPAATRMARPLGLPLGELLPADVVVAPTVWLASTGSNGFNGRRIVASRWLTDLEPEAAATRAGEPVAWTGLQASRARKVEASVG